MREIGTLGAEKGSLVDSESEQKKVSAALPAPMAREHGGQRRAVRGRRSDRFGFVDMDTYCTIALSLM